MYPRLILARNLLAQDGVIFVSIDDNEYANLKALLDEVFGAENSLGCITIVSNLKGRSDDKYFATAHNYLLGYQRSNFAPRGVPLPSSYRNDYPEVDDEGSRFRLQGLRKRGNSTRREDRPSMYYPFYVDPASGQVSLEKCTGFTAEVLPYLSDGAQGRWRWGRETAAARLNELMARPVGTLRRWDIFQIDALARGGAERRVVPKTVWEGSEVANEAGTLELKKLMGSRIFETPKPTGLIRQILEYTVGRHDLVVDFFAGSGSTAHAVAMMNEADGGMRRVISVNIQEPTPADSEARRQGYETVSAITRARLAAVMETIPSAQAQGLRSYVLGRSNFRDETTLDPGDLFDLRESTLDDGDHLMEEVAAEVLLNEGVPLDATWTRDKAGDATVITSDSVAVVISLAVSDAVATEALARRPRVLIFLEDGFAGRDAVKANAYTNAKNLGITMKTV